MSRGQQTGRKMRFQDYYATLGVSRDADEKQIKKAYRDQARKLHPDVNKNADAEERFKGLNEAYAVLSDADKRSRYDRFGADWEQYQTSSNGSQSDFSQWFNRSQDAPGGVRFEYRSSGDEGFSDFFETLFGGSRQAGPRRGRAPRRGDDYEHPVQIGLREAFTGTTRVFEAQVPATCDECHGTGMVRGELCFACGGSGSVQQKSRVEVTIPAGIRDGQRVRVAGKGSPGSNGGPPGDVYLKVQIKPDHEFTIENSDLRTDLEVPLYTALLGGEVVVRTLTGKVALTIPAETQNGRVFRLRGQGWPLTTNSSERGDLLARVTVKLPARLSDAERRAFEELRDARSATGNSTQA